MPLTDLDGRPQPPSEIQSRLRAVHPLLSLRFIQGLGAVWAICMAWDDNDPRWETVQDGRTDPAAACSIIGYLPHDCSLDEAASYIARSIRTYPTDAVKNLIPRLDKYNEALLTAEAEKVLGELLDRPDPSAVKARGYGGRRKKVTLATS